MGGDAGGSGVRTTWIYPGFEKGSPALPGTSLTSSIPRKKLVIVAGKGTSAETITNHNVALEHLFGSGSKS